MKIGKDIKGVIFDVDGVLLDSMQIWTDLGARYLYKMRKSPEKGLADILFNMSMEQGAAYLRERYLPDLTNEKVMDGLQGMLRDFYYYEVKAKPGMKELLKALRHADIRVTAATSSPRGHIEKALERNGLLEYIEKMFTSSEVGSSKHSSEIYDVAADFMGLNKNEICVFEDSLYALKTAVKAGYHTVGFYDANGEPDQKGLEEAADEYIRSNYELIKLFI